MVFRLLLSDGRFRKRSKQLWSVAQSFQARLQAYCSDFVRAIIKAPQPIIMPDECGFLID